jgi:hypothetical protein
LPPTATSDFRRWHFINGHGVQEKTTAELKSGLAYGDIPTADLGGRLHGFVRDALGASLRRIDVPGSLES